MVFQTHACMCPQTPPSLVPYHPHLQVHDAQKLQHPGPLRLQALPPPLTASTPTQHQSLAPQLLPGRPVITQLLAGRSVLASGHTQLLAGRPVLAAEHSHQLLAGRPVLVAERSPTVAAPDGMPSVPLLRGTPLAISGTAVPSTVLAYRSLPLHPSQDTAFLGPSKAPHMVRVHRGEMDGIVWFFYMLSSTLPLSQIRIDTRTFAMMQ